MANIEKAPTRMKTRMKAQGRGSVFVASDFFDIANKKSVRETLLRMEKEGLVERVIRGVYLFPEYSELLGKKVPADPSKVAQAIARNYNWTISPDGEAALNQLGLSTQIPSSHEYLSDGPYKSYAYGKVQLVFKHRANREMTGMSFKTRVATQALKSLGKEYVDEAVVKRLAMVFSSEEAERFFMETRHSSDWIHDAADRLRKEAGDAQFRKA